MKPTTIIERLNATSGRIEKEQILFDAFMTGHREFFIAARLAYDPLISFGVKKVPLIEEEDDGLPGTFEFNDFLSLADKLYHREYTGNDSKHALQAAATVCNIGLWNNFYRRVLLKNLSVGVEDKTINKVLKKIGDDAKDFLIPIFGCQLAIDGADEKHAKKIRGRKMIDVKLDGVRLLTVLDKESGTVTQYTRNGKENANFTEITGALQRVLAEIPGSVVLDGEIVSTSFQDLMTQVNRREGVDTSKTRLALYDIVPLGDFRAGHCAIPQETRHQVLVELTKALQEHTDGLVYVVPKVTIDLDTPVGVEHFRQLNREALDAKYEGIMIKDPDAAYECKRGAAWIKVKPFIEVTLKVVGFEPGDPDKGFANTLGALVLEGEDDGFEYETNVSSGFSHALRDEVWANKEKYLGMMVEVKADARTQARGSTTYSLRFPVFKGWRGTVPGEKL